MGKAEKSIFLCDYPLPSQETQHEVHEGLNVVENCENWNATNDFICYGRQGELATNRTFAYWANLSGSFSEAREKGGSGCPHIFDGGLVDFGWRLLRERPVKLVDKSSLGLPQKKWTRRAQLIVG